MIGFHLTVDGTVSEMPSERDISTILSELPIEIGMNILEGPIVVKGNPHNPGLTGIVIIDTSHIAIHTFEEGNEVSVDIFSCKEFDKNIALAYLERKISFRKDSLNLKFFERKHL